MASTRPRGLRLRTGVVTLLLVATCMVVTKLAGSGCFIPPTAMGLRPHRTEQVLGGSGLVGAVILPSIAHAEEGTPESQAANALVEQWRAFSANPDQFRPEAVSIENANFLQLGTLTGRADQEVAFLVVGGLGFAAAFIVKFVLPDPRDEPVDIEAAKARPRPEWVIQRDLKEADEVRRAKELKDRVRGRGMREGVMPR
mmetsp:Transcript_33553/g.77397  ORF Transcript_33553/g.77397 Transcript_33553/m.77397 type:complete len:199 (-) Transcript_33553:260-856(-)